MDAGLILYLHGFCSSPASWKSRLLAEELARRGQAAQFICPQLSPVPDEAVAQAASIIKAATGPVTLVGSSLGGHYANHLAERFALNAVLINPAIVAQLDLGLFVGEHTHFHGGPPFRFTVEHAEQLRRQVAPPSAGHYWLLLEEGDEVLDWRQAHDFYAGCRQEVFPDGDHSFTRFPQFVSQIIEFSKLNAGL